jgi:hypothetical protein
LWVVAGALAAALGALACGGTPAGPGGATSAASPAPSAGVIGSAPPTTTSPAPPPLAAPLTCGQLRNAAVTTATVKLSDYPSSSINLTNGRWTGGYGAEIVLQDPCGIGNIVGDNALDAVGAVVLSTGGTGRFYSLVAWRNSAGSPVLAATLAIGDRNPVVDISIASKKITVVYLTRDDSASMAELNIKRTAVYKVSGTVLVELSHADVPYIP